MKILVKWKHRAEKIIAVDVMLTNQLHAHIVEQNAVTVYAITALLADELVNLSSLLII